jgi:hypothetical protein
MSTPNYKGPGQPMPSSSDGLTGWLGGFLGGTAAPAYKPAPTAPMPAPTPCPPCPSVPAPKPAPSCRTPTQQTPIQHDHDSGTMQVPELFVLGDDGDAVIPVGPGPITIVIQPRG